MALPEKDLRLHFAADVYAAMETLAEIEGLPLKHWAEAVIEKEAARKVHIAKIVAHAADAAGSSWVQRVLMGRGV